MGSWSTAERDRCDRAGEARVAGRRADGTSRTLTMVWHVVVDGLLRQRSVQGHDSSDEAVDAASLDSCGDDSPTRAIASDVATRTTLRVDPR